MTRSMPASNIRLNTHQFYYRRVDDMKQPTSFVQKFARDSSNLYHFLFARDSSNI